MWNQYKSINKIIGFGFHTNSSKSNVYFMLIEYVNSSHISRVLSCVWFVFGIKNGWLTFPTELTPELCVYWYVLWLPYWAGLVCWLYVAVVTLLAGARPAWATFQELQRLLTSWLELVLMVSFTLRLGRSSESPRFYLESFSVVHLFRAS
jgi:hypothetical protein